MKLSDVKAGDVLIADGGFTCLRPGEHEVKASDKGELYIACDDGKHMLCGQVDFKDPDLLVGLSSDPMGSV